MIGSMRFVVDVPLERLAAFVELAGEHRWKVADYAPTPEPEPDKRRKKRRPQRRVDREVWERIKGGDDMGYSKTLLYEVRCTESYPDFLAKRHMQKQARKNGKE